MILLLVLDVPVLVVLLAIVLVIAVVAVLWLGDCRVTPRPGTPTLVYRFLCVATADQRRDCTK